MVLSRIFFALATLVASVPWLGFPLIACIFLPLAICRSMIAMAHRWGILQFCCGLACGIYLMSSPTTSAARPTAEDFAEFRPYAHTLLFRAVAMCAGSQTLETAQAMSKYLASVLYRVDDLAHGSAKLADSFGRWV